MKKLLLISSFIFALFSCTVDEAPEYKKIQNIKIENISKQDVLVSAEAFYYNPNHIGGSVKKVDIDLFIDDAKIAEVLSAPFEINSQDDFKVPLKANIPYKKLFGSSGKQILGNLLNAVVNKKTKINYKGKITIDFGKFEYDYELDEVMELDLSKS